MNLMIQPNQICLIVKLYNNRPELLPDSNGLHYQIQGVTHLSRPLLSCQKILTLKSPWP